MISFYNHRDGLFEDFEKEFDINIGFFDFIPNLTYIECSFDETHIKDVKIFKDNLKQNNHNLLYYYGKNAEKNKYQNLQPKKDEAFEPYLIGKKNGKK